MLNVNANVYRWLSKLTIPKKMSLAFGLPYSQGKPRRHAVLLLEPPASGFQIPIRIICLVQCTAA